MKLFSSLHDPKQTRYTIYYSTVLLVVIITALLLVTETLEFTVTEGIMIFFEGFVSLYMITRNEKVANSFASHLKHAGDFFKLSSAGLAIAGIILFEKINDLISKITFFSKT
ncbi:MAG: hypothetical protein IH841_01230 [Thaumarchaeota archaeon]|nr:hypothetical protein [Nitrososphaerota archaeon]